MGLYDNDEDYQLDLKDLAAQKMAADQRKQEMLATSGMLNATSSAPSAAEFYLGKFAPIRGHGGDGLKDMAEALPNPLEDKARLQSLLAKNQEMQGARRDLRRMDGSTPEGQSAIESMRSLLGKDAGTLPEGADLQSLEAGAKHFQPMQQAEQRHGFELGEEDQKFKHGMTAQSAKSSQDLSNKLAELDKEYGGKAMVAGLKPPKGYTREVDPTTGEVTMVPSIKQLPADKVLGVNEGNNLPAMLNDVEKSLGAASSEMGPVMGRLTGNNPYNQKAATLDAQLRTTSQMIGKYLEGGVLRKEDEEKYRKMLPVLTDTADVAKNKLQLVRRMLARKQQSDLSALKNSNYNTDGLASSAQPPELPDVLSGKGGGGGIPGIPSANASEGGGFDAKKKARLEELRKKRDTGMLK